MDSADRLQAFLSGFVFEPYCTDTGTIGQPDCEETAEDFLDTLRDSLTEYKAVYDQVPVETLSPEVQALFAASMELLADAIATDPANVTDLQPKINAMQAAALPLVS